MDSVNQWLLENGNEIVKSKINADFENKEIKQSDHVFTKYWFDKLNGDVIFNSNGIHGRKDDCVENFIAKILDMGYSKVNASLNKYCSAYINNKIWNRLKWQKIILYPFLIRAGYGNNANIKDYANERIHKIKNTINKYGFDYIQTKKDNNRYILHGDFYEHPFPSCYDLYAFAFFNQTDYQKPIDFIIEYILDEKFQNMPEKAYYMEKGRPTAAGKVFHACLQPQRYLLFVYLFSFFKKSFKCEWYKRILDNLDTYKTSNDTYIFSKDYLKEKKDSYYLYSGAHMGFGEDRRNKKWIEIESTLWMQLIKKNRDKTFPDG